MPHLNRLSFSFFAVLLTCVVLPLAAAVSRDFVDPAGRRVTVPDRIERVFVAGPPASTLLYTLAPEKMLGWIRAPSPAERPYLAPAYRDLPVTGRLAGQGSTANSEAVVKYK